MDHLKGTRDLRFELPPPLYEDVLLSQEPPSYQQVCDRNHGNKNRKKLCGVSCLSNTGFKEYCARDLKPSDSSKTEVGSFKSFQDGGVGVKKGGRRFEEESFVGIRDLMKSVDSIKTASLTDLNKRENGGSSFQNGLQNMQSSVKSLFRDSYSGFKMFQENIKNSRETISDHKENKYSTQKNETKTATEDLGLPAEKKSSKESVGRKRQSSNKKSCLKPSTLFNATKSSLKNEEKLDSFYKEDEINLPHIEGTTWSQKRLKDGRFSPVTEISRHSFIQATDLDKSTTFLGSKSRQTSMKNSEILRATLSKKLPVRKALDLSASELKTSSFYKDGDVPEKEKVEKIGKTEASKTKLDEFYDPTNDPKNEEADIKKSNLKSNSFSSRKNDVIDTKKINLKSKSFFDQTPRVSSPKYLVSQYKQVFDPPTSKLEDMYDQLFNPIEEFYKKAKVPDNKKSTEAITNPSLSRLAEFSKQPPRTTKKELSESHTKLPQKSLQEISPNQPTSQTTLLTNKPQANTTPNQQQIQVNTAPNAQVLAPEKCSDPPNTLISKLPEPLAQNIVAPMQTYSQPSNTQDSLPCYDDIFKPLYNVPNPHFVPYNDISNPPPPVPTELCRPAVIPLRKSSMNRRSDFLLTPTVPQHFKPMFEPLPPELSNRFHVGFDQSALMRRKNVTSQHPFGWTPSFTPEGFAGDMSLGRQKEILQRAFYLQQDWRRSARKNSEDVRKEDGEKDDDDVSERRSSRVSEKKGSEISDGTVGSVSEKKIVRISGMKNNEHIDKENTENVGKRSNRRQKKKKQKNTQNQCSNCFDFKMMKQILNLMSSQQKQHQQHQLPQTHDQNSQILPSILELLTELVCNKNPEKPPTPHLPPTPHTPQTRHQNVEADPCCCCVVDRCVGAGTPMRGTGCLAGVSRPLSRLKQLQSFAFDRVDENFPQLDQLSVNNSSKKPSTSSLGRSPLDYLTQSNLRLDAFNDAREPDLTQHIALLEDALATQIQHNERMLRQSQAASQLACQPTCQPLPVCPELTKLSVEQKPENMLDIASIFELQQKVSELQKQLNKTPPSPQEVIITVNHQQPPPLPLPPPQHLTFHPDLAVVEPSVSRLQPHTSHRSVRPSLLPPPSSTPSHYLPLPPPLPPPPLPHPPTSHYLPPPSTPFQYFPPPPSTHSHHPPPLPPSAPSHYLPPPTPPPSLPEPPPPPLPHTPLSQKPQKVRPPKQTVLSTSSSSHPSHPSHPPYPYPCCCCCCVSSSSSSESCCCRFQACSDSSCDGPCICCNCGSGKGGKMCLKNCGKDGLCFCCGSSSSSSSEEESEVEQKVDVIERAIEVLSNSQPSNEPMVNFVEVKQKEMKELPKKIPYYYEKPPPTKSLFNMPLKKASSSYLKKHMKETKRYFNDKVKSIENMVRLESEESKSRLNLEEPKYEEIKKLGLDFGAINSDFYNVKPFKVHEKKSWNSDHRRNSFTRDSNVNSSGSYIKNHPSKYDDNDDGGGYKRYDDNNNGKYTTSDSEDYYVPRPSKNSNRSNYNKNHSSDKASLNLPGFQHEGNTKDTKKQFQNKNNIMQPKTSTKNIGKTSSSTRKSEDKLNKDIKKVRSKDKIRKKNLKNVSSSRDMVEQKLEKNMSKRKRLSDHKSIEKPSKEKLSKNKFSEEKLLRETPTKSKSKMSQNSLKNSEKSKENVKTLHREKQKTPPKNNQKNKIEKNNKNPTKKSPINTTDNSHEDRIEEKIEEDLTKEILRLQQSISERQMAGEFGLEPSAHELKSEINDIINEIENLIAFC